MALLFDMDDVAYLEAELTPEQLKREKHHAELEIHAANFWYDPESADYWTEYLDAVTCAIAEQRRKYRAAHPVNTDGPKVSAADVKARLDIVNVIEQYVPLRKNGKLFDGLCPFHDEKNPSFKVSPDRQTWHCFSCNRGGDVFDFIQAIENVDFKTALYQLARY